MKKFVFLSILSLMVGFSQAQWQIDQRLTNNISFSKTSGSNNSWNIATNGDTLHVVWEDYRDFDYEIYYKRSTDGGITWDPDTRLTNNMGASRIPFVAVSGSIVHVIWEDYRDNDWEVYYKRSTDGGFTWGPDTRLTYYIWGSGTGSIATVNSVLHLVWQDYRNLGDGEIYFKRSTDAGNNWGSDIRISNDTAYSGYPSVAVSGSVVHVVWEDERDGNGEVYYIYSTNDGISWGPETRLTNDSHNSWDPCISVNGSNIHVVWMDDRDGNYEIYYKRSIDGGVNWEDDTRLTNDPGFSIYPNIAVLSGTFLHVVWADDRDGNSENYYKRSVDGGISWENDIRITDDNDTSICASIAVSGSALHVLWTDTRDGNWEVYYKRNPSGNIVGIENVHFNANEQEISIFPNPASTFIHINIKSSKSPVNEQLPASLQFMIRNILGEVVIITPYGGLDTTLDVSALPCGFYMLEIRDKNKYIVGTRLIISR